MSKIKTGQQPRLTEVEVQAIEEVVFLRLHPEMNHYVGALLGTVVSCIRSGMTLERAPLEEAFHHVFGGGGGTTGCDRCRATFITKQQAYVEEWHRRCSS